MYRYEHNLLHSSKLISYFISHGNARGNECTILSARYVHSTHVRAAFRWPSAHVAFQSLKNKQQRRDVFQCGHLRRIRFVTRRTWNPATTALSFSQKTTPEHVRELHTVPMACTQKNETIAISKFENGRKCEDKRYSSDSNAR